MTENVVEPFSAHSVQHEPGVAGSPVCTASAAGQPDEAPRSDSSGGALIAIRASASRKDGKEKAAAVNHSMTVRVPLPGPEFRKR